MYRDAFLHALSEAAATGLSWRVPNAKELHGIFDHARRGPAVDPAIFPNTPRYLFWTSTAYAWTPTGGWMINSEYGDVLAYYNGYAGYIRLVRDAP